MNEWLKIVQRIMGSCLRIPCYCILCLQPTYRDFALCRACEINLPWLGPHCTRCAMPIENGVGQMQCRHCLTIPPEYDRLQSLFEYRWPLDVFIGKLKYGGQLHFSRMLGSLMAQKLTPLVTPDCIIPMPMHPLRQRERGFNQTIELASIIAKKRNWKLDRWSCIRSLHTQAQSKLSAKIRAKNLTPRTFAVHKDFCAKKVLIIEDVVTTGATINALTIALKRANVKTIEIWSTCRTIL